jgi:hypothetical protein
MTIQCSGLIDDLTTELVNADSVILPALHVQLYEAYVIAHQIYFLDRKAGIDTSCMKKGDDMNEP